MLQLDLFFSYWRQVPLDMPVTHCIYTHTEVRWFERDRNIFWNMVCLVKLSLITPFVFISDFRVRIYYKKGAPRPHFCKKNIRRLSSWRWIVQAIVKSCNSLMCNCLKGHIVNRKPIATPCPILFIFNLEANIQLEWTLNKPWVSS